jgi:hypothetical protein
MEITTTGLDYESNLDMIPTTGIESMNADMMM